MTTTSDEVQKSFSLDLKGLEKTDSMIKSPKHKVGNKIANLANIFEQKVETNKGLNSSNSFLSARERSEELEKLKKTKNAYSSLNFFSGLIEKKKKEEEIKKSLNKWNTVKSAVSEQPMSPPSQKPQIKNEKEKSAPTSPKKTIEKTKPTIIIKSAPTSSITSPRIKIPQE